VTRMDPLDIISLVASIATALTAIIGILYVSRSLRQSERSLRFNACFQTMEMLEKTRDARHLLENKVTVASSDKNLSNLTPAEKERLDELVKSYDKLALLVKYGTVPLEFVLDYYSRGIVVTWNRLHPWIEEERIKRHQPGHMKLFELLAIEAKKHRDTEHPGEETFDLTSQQKTEWKTWRVTPPIDFLRTFFPLIFK
jgi:hypothetical protein